jgi:general secretion pathway protein F
MPIFDYKGLTRDGRNTKGVIDAENLRAARAKLKKDNIYVVDIKDKKKGDPRRKKGPRSTKKVSVNDLALMTRQLATLIKANIPLVDALLAVSEQVENPALAEAVADCKNMVNEGATLHKSLQKYPHIFTNIYISMAEAGELSGSLDVMLMRLAEFTEAQAELRAKVSSAMTYPVIMLVVTGGLLSFLFIFLIPKMVTVFESAPTLVLPWYTVAMISLSQFMVNYWYLIFGSLFIAFILFKNWKNSPTGRIQWDTISLKLPLMGPTIRMVAVSRFTRTLGTLLKGGVPMLTALDIVRNVVDNHVLAMAIDEARSNISEGETISGPLKKSGQFPPIVIHMVNIGEKTGDIENMLMQVSEAYDFQVKNKLESLTSLMGPVVIVIMGFAIAMIVFAVMIPMFEMTNLAG